MPSGSCQTLADMPAHVRAIFEGGRRGVLATVDRDGYPHAVPVCFAIRGDEVISPIDHKPKSTRMLARVRNIAANAGVTLLVDRWDEDWTTLGWVMVRGDARLQEDGGRELLTTRYPQFRNAPEPAALIVIAVRRILWWTWS